MIVLALQISYDSLNFVVLSKLISLKFNWLLKLAPTSNGWIFLSNPVCLLFPQNNIRRKYGGNDRINESSTRYRFICWYDPVFRRTCAHGEGFIWIEKYRYRNVKHRSHLTIDLDDSISWNKKMSQLDDQLQDMEYQLQEIRRFIGVERESLEAAKVRS